MLLPVLDFWVDSEAVTVVVVPVATTAVLVNTLLYTELSLKLVALVVMVAVLAEIPMVACLMAVPAVLTATLVVPQPSSESSLKLVAVLMLLVATLAEVPAVASLLGVPTVIMAVLMLAVAYKSIRSSPKAAVLAIMALVLAVGPLVILVAGKSQYEQTSILVQRISVI